MTINVVADQDLVPYLIHGQGRDLCHLVRGAIRPPDHAAAVDHIAVEEVLPIVADAVVADHTRHPDQGLDHTHPHIAAALHRTEMIGECTEEVGAEMIIVIEGGVIRRGLRNNVPIVRMIGGTIIGRNI